MWMLNKRQVNKIRYQSLKKMLSNAGGMSAGGAETTSTRRKAAVSLNCLPLAAYLIRRPNCFVNDHVTSGAGPRAVGMERGRWS